MRFISAALFGAALLAGCTTFSKDGGFDAVSSTAEARLGEDAVIVKTDADRDAAAARTQALLAQPLSMDDAVQVALLNNRGLQASYAELGLAEAMLKVAADTRRAYIEAVSAQQAADYAEQVRDSADAGAELASRMRQAGNFSKLDEAREQAFYAESVADLAQARQRAVLAREKLTRTMGLSGEDTRYRLPERLPDLPKERPDLNDVEQFAMENRLDIRAEKLRAQANRHAANRLAQTAIGARSEVREAYSAYTIGYDVAKHYRDDVVPLRKTISDEMLLRYNGMLASVFDLLADSREQAGAVNRYIDALKRYWLARTDLEQALGGRLPAPGATPEPLAASPQASAKNSQGK